MSAVPLPPGVPGIRALLTTYPDTAGPLMALAQSLLRGPSPLTQGHRELLATAVSAVNGCVYCSQTHGAAARALLGEQADWVDAVLAGGLPDDAKLAALVAVARQTALSVAGASSESLAAARVAGAIDREIHDTVLIAAAFCLYNRYVDGLGTSVPADPSDYAAIGARLARFGYQ